MQKIGAVLKWHIKSHQAVYIIMMIIFTVGFIVGAANSAYLGIEEKQETATQIEMFIKTVENEDFDRNLLLKEIIITNLKPLVLIWVLGLVIIGVPLIFMYIGIYSYSIGFTISLILNVFGIVKGSLIILFLVIPQEIILIPIIFFVSLNAIIFSDMVGTTLKSNVKKDILTYSAIFIVSSVFVLLSSLFQVYVIGQLVS